MSEIVNEESGYAFANYLALETHIAALRQTQQGVGWTALRYLESEIAVREAELAALGQRADVQDDALTRGGVAVTWLSHFRNGVDEADAPFMRESIARYSGELSTVTRLILAQEMTDERALRINEAMRGQKLAEPVVSPLPILSSEQRLLRYINTAGIGASVTNHTLETLIADGSERKKLVNKAVAGKILEPTQEGFFVLRKPGVPAAVARILDPHLTPEHALLLLSLISRRTEELGIPAIDLPLLEQTLDIQDTISPEELKSRSKGLGYATSLLDDPEAFVRAFELVPGDDPRYRLFATILGSATPRRMVQQLTTRKKVGVVITEQGRKVPGGVNVSTARLASKSKYSDLITALKAVAYDDRESPLYRPNAPS